MSGLSQRLPSLDAVQQARAYHSLKYFLGYESNGRWKSGNHLDVLTNTLERVSSGELRRVIVTMPPRHGKSEVVSKKFPAWHIGRNPEDEMIISSYSIDLSRGFSRLARDTLAANTAVFETEVDPDNKGAESWGVKGHRGGLNAAGVGGPITGKGARIAIIDDPIKNAEEANSQVMRQKVWDWYTSTLYTRLTPDGRIVVVMTRWHEDDLVGRLLKKEEEDIAAGVHEGERWTVINFPALAEADDYLGRDPDEPLWPEYGFDAKRLAQIRRDVGSYVFNALYQQRPSAAEGAMLKRHWWQYYTFDPTRKAYDEMVQSWDCTFKDSDGSDYVVGQVWGRIGANKYLLDQVRARMDINATMQAITQLSAKWPRAKLKLVEDKANGPAVIQMLRNKIGGLVPVNPEGGKIARASAVAPEIEAGNVFLPEGAAWVSDFVEECAAFPRGAHDDQVDAMTQAINRLQYRFIAQPGPEEKGGFYTPTEREELGGNQTSGIRRLR
ncbi:putative phage terminase large subunit-like protein [Paenibacillus cellulosilyticus]|uniref:Putative phage terminase large subunit-like protein n=1 Tax=Paenibacillus cellulosilyticus TaxID=375489 RepID=A0A2V2YDY1_9BACL|nr:phage terminase large subunit [Paenibacillus cellulosilyticus]PWV90246.1 putative phage terminase large subunit-like protein [Paenibacillus cellulosilyticus]QKS43404.1 phage terminase large subunit [Paenibacillus cellulosilyticus]